MSDLLDRMAAQLRSMRKLHDPTGHCHCFTCYQIIALLVEYDTNKEKHEDKVLTCELDTQML